MCKDDLIEYITDLLTNPKRDIISVVTKQDVGESDIHSITIKIAPSDDDV